MADPPTRLASSSALLHHPLQLHRPATSTDLGPPLSLEPNPPATKRSLVSNSR